MARRVGTYYGGNTLLDGRNASWFSPKKRKKNKPRPEDMEPPRPKPHVGLINRPFKKEAPRLITASEMCSLKSKKRRT